VRLAILAFAPEICLVSDVSFLVLSLPDFLSFLLLKSFLNAREGIQSFSRGFTELTALLMLMSSKEQHQRVAGS
jgi:hypothetical protein